MSFDITPDKSIIRKLGYTGYGIVDAISELIDNAVDARLDSVNIRVTIDSGRSEITISDNGVGMDKPTLNAALTLAKETTADKKNRIGMFGLGLKTACSTLGRNFIINTATKNSKLYSVEYEEDTWEKDRTKDWKNFPYHSTVKPHDEYHGTEIIIKNLKMPIKPHHISVFRRQLGKRYSKYMNVKQVIITVNGIVCTPIEPAIEKNSTKTFNITVSGKTIPVKIWLLKKRSIKGDYGMNLYNKGRLIKAHADFGIGKHPVVAKIAGEIALEHVPVNFHKTDFITDSDEYIKARDAFASHKIVKDTIISQRNSKVGTPIINSIHEYFSGARKEPPKIDARMGGKSTTKKMLGVMNPLEFRIGKKNLRIVFDERDATYTAKKSKSNLEITVGTNSPVFRITKNPFYLVAMIVSEAKAILMVDHYSQEFFDVRNTMWEKFASEMIPEKLTKPEITNDHMKNYGISRSLKELDEHLNLKHKNRYTFTALSTLKEYAHNAIGTPMYSLYVEKNSGEILQDTIKKFEKFLTIRDPSSSELKKILDSNYKREIIIIREYAKAELEKRITKPATAWMDMYREVMQYGLPLSHGDLLTMFENLFYNKMITQNQIITIAARRKNTEKIAKFVEEVTSLAP